MMTANSATHTVRLHGGCPWGFRLQGGVKTGQPLTVSKIRRKSKAHNNLFEGDVIVSINGHPCEKLTHDQAMCVVDAASTELTLEVARSESNKENIIPATLTSGTYSGGHTKVTEQSQYQQIKSTVIRSNTPPVSSCLGLKPSTIIQSETPLIPSEIGFKPLTVTHSDASCPGLKPEPPETQRRSPSAERLIPINIEPREILTPSPLGGSAKTVTQEVTTDGNKLEKTTTETIQETKGSCQTTIFRKEKESITKDKFVTGKNVPEILPPTLLRESSSSPSPSVIKVTKFETTSSETKNQIWKPGNLEQRPRKVEAPIFKECSSEKEVIRNTEPVTKATENEPRHDVKQTQSEGSSSLPRRKKTFSSSSFYEDPQVSYPTIEEQVSLCRQIADSLCDDSEKKSKAASLFDKRMKRSNKFIHENPDTPGSEDDPSLMPDFGTEPEVNIPYDMPPRPKSKTPPSLKLILDPRLPQDAAMLKTSGHQISEHNVVTPDICHDLVKDLESPVGRGGALFAKRRQKAENWVVDEEIVKSHTKTPEPLPEPAVPPLQKLQEKFQQTKLKLVKSPWEAALQSPIGSCDGAFMDARPVQLAETVMKAAENKIRSNSQSPVSENGYMNVSYSATPSVAGFYKPKAPRGWKGKGPVSQHQQMSTGSTGPSSEPVTTRQQAFQQHRSSPPNFQNFNTVAKTWREAKNTDVSAPSGFRPVRPPTWLSK